MVAAKLLEKKLGCTDEPSLRRLQIVLDALEKIGILVKERGKYRRVFEAGIVEAKLRCSSKGFCFAIQNLEGAADIYVRESHLSTAWNGDRVLVKITKEGNRRRSPEGEVKLILERANPSVLARIKQGMDTTGKVIYKAVPLDDRLLFELDLVPNGQDLTAAIDHLIHAEIVRYPLASYPPIGRVAQVLGSDAEAAADIDIVCCKHDLPRKFSATLLSSLEKFSSKISKTELKNRLDLRHLITLTVAPAAGAYIDPKTLLVEQAFTLEKIEGELWRVGIHIVDVAHYVAPDSPVDREAKRRGRSVHLGDTVLPMLPEPLLNHCSLLPGQNHLAISVLLSLSNDGEVVEFEIQKSAIQVDFQLTESQAQAILLRHHTDLDLERSNLEELSPVFATLDQLFVLSQSIRKKRLERGSFELNLPWEGSQFNDEGIADSMISLPNHPAQSMVREFMTLVNQVVGSHFVALGVPGMYRVQPAPDPDDAVELHKLASNLAIDLQLENEEAVTPFDFQK
ncbi:MAG TPA: ribonuclease R family protein, partial [Phormidium sp.]